MKEKSLFKGCLTVPNLLSLIRIFLIPVFAVLFYKGETIWAVVVLALSGFSDFIDGKIARRFNQISELGKVLDPAADKLTQVSIAVMLFIEFYKCSIPAMRSFAWVFLLFLGKEVFMMIAAVIMLSCGFRAIAAEIYGKVATFVFYAVMILIIAFGPEVGAFTGLWTLPTLMLQILVVLSAVLTFIAFFSYFPPSYRELKALRERKAAAAEKKSEDNK